MWIGDFTVFIGDIMVSILKIQITYWYFALGCTLPILIFLVWEDFCGMSFCRTFQIFCWVPPEATGPLRGVASLLLLSISPPRRRPCSVFPLLQPSLYFLYLWHVSWKRWMRLCLPGHAAAAVLLETSQCIIFFLLEISCLLFGNVNLPYGLFNGIFTQIGFIVG